MTNILPNPQILLFDWSGTVSDDRKPVYEANQRLLEAYGQPRLTLEEWRDGREGWNAGNFIAKKLKQPTEPLYAEFAKILTEVKSEIGEPQPYLGAVEAVRAVSSGRRSEIISSHPQKHLEHEVQSYGIGESIKRIHGSVSDKVPVISLALEEAGLSPEQALYIGDTLQDIRAARQANIQVAAVTYGYHSEDLLRAEQPDIIISSLDELASLLAKF